MRASLARWILAGGVLLSALFSGIALWHVSYGGAVSFRNVLGILPKLGALYFPLIAIMVTGVTTNAHQESGQHVSRFTFAFLAVIVFGCCLFPVLLILAVQQIEDTTVLLEWFALGTNTSSAAALTYYFLKE